MKLTKMMMVGSMLLVPTLAMGIAQQDPANPASPAGQQLQQDQAAMPASEHEHTGVIAEVRDDSFSIRTNDQGVLWFMITPGFKSSYSAELVTGNRVTVSAKAGATADKMDALRIERAEGTETADVDVDIDVDRDLDTDVDVETDTQIADTDTSLRDDDADYDTDSDSDELPRTASSLPEIGALGLLALLGAAVVAFARRF